MVRLNKLALIGLSAVAMLGWGAMSSAALQAVVPNSAVADAYLETQNFTILRGNQAHGKGSPIALCPPFGPAIGCEVTINSIVTNSNVVADLIGDTQSDFTSTTAPGAPFSHAVQTDNAGEFVVGTTVPAGQQYMNNFAASHSSAEGLAVAPIPAATVHCGGSSTGDCNTTHSQINLVSGQLGSADANQNFTTEFVFTVNNTDDYEVNFDADAYLLAQLAQDIPGDNAFASKRWDLTVTDITNPFGQFEVLFWSPNGAAGGLQGSCVAAVTCTEFADAFGLTNSQSTNSLGAAQDDDDNNNGTGLGGNGEFEVELNLVAGQTYRITIAHEVVADAQLPIPEPGTLALIGLGVLGAGVVRRRSKK